MAAKATLVERELTLKIKTGLDAKGKDKITTKNIKNVKVTATDQGLLDTGTVFGTLLKYPIKEVLKSESYLIINE